MAKGDGMTPSAVVSKLRSNMNNNGTLKSLYASQLLGKLSIQELNGIALSCKKEIARREQEKVDEMRATLERLGYKVEKK